MVLPTIILPGYFARWTDYSLLAESLKQRGIPTTIVPLRKRDWLPTLGGRSVVPVIRAIDATVQGMLKECESDRVNLIGHSAGGWIARIYLGDVPYTVHRDVTATDGVWQIRDRVAALISLGTPHISQERWTRRNLDFVNNNYPGAFYSDLKYVCVAGKAVYGKQWESWLAYNSYKLTCGEGSTWGDGITPISAAHLQGATNLTIEGAKHSPQSGFWYGSPEAIAAWVDYLE
ncbi:MAG: lipase [Cyanobacteria bacterium P01_E01_bin.42]